MKTSTALLYAFLIALLVVLVLEVHQIENLKSKLAKDARLKVARPNPVKNLSLQTTTSLPSIKLSPTVNLGSAYQQTSSSGLASGSSEIAAYTMNTGLTAVTTDQKREGFDVKARAYHSCPPSNCSSYTLDRNKINSVKMNPFMWPYSGSMYNGSSKAADQLKQEPDHEGFV